VRGFPAYHPAVGPAPTNVGQVPQSSVTVNRTSNEPALARRIAKLVWFVPGA
jgi:hypothetical protein